MPPASPASSQKRLKRGNSSGPGPPELMARPARRHAELAGIARGAQVGGAEHRHPVVLAVGIHHREAGEAGLGQLARRMAGRHVEEVGGELELARGAVRQNADLDRQLEVAPGMEEADLGGARHVAPEHAVRAVGDLVVQIVVDRLEQRRVGDGRLDVGLLCQRARHVAQHLERKGHRRPGVDRQGGGPARQERRRAHGKSGGEEGTSGRAQGHVGFLLWWRDRGAGAMLTGRRARLKPHVVRQPSGGAARVGR